jgi:hypothetical protein
MKNNSRFAVMSLIIMLTLINATEFDPMQFKNRKLQAVKLSEPLNIDGILDESIYLGQSYSDYVQYVPINGSPATEKTEIWIGYDESAIYVGARMWDSEPDKIVSRIGRRDENDDTDLFEIIIDSYHDKRTGFSFQINPIGAINDEVYFNDAFTQRSWDGIWEGVTNIDNEGWTAELRIPYSQLRFDEKEEYTWGFQSARYIQRKDEWDYFSYQSLEESGLIRHAAELSGLHNISPPQRAEVRPYITSGLSNLPGKENNPFYNGKDSDLGIGADFKLGIGNNITVDGTINPDFGQVEADPSEINLSAYETYYREKRPFFIEGQNIFTFGRGGPTNNISINFSEPHLFYSRRIGRQPQGYITASPDSVQMPGVTNILGAAKISGRIQGGWLVGGLTAFTDQEQANYYSNGKELKQMVEPATFFNVVRAQKEIKDGKYGVGIIGTNVYRFLDGIEILGGVDDEHSLHSQLAENSSTIGIDGWSFFGPNNDWGVGGWLATSKVSGSKKMIYNLQNNSSHYFQRPDVDHVNVDSDLRSLNGYAGRIKLNKETGNFVFNAAVGFISPGFESNDIGYQGRTDIINKHIGIGYNWTKPTDYYRAMFTVLLFANNHDFSGTPIGNEIAWISQVRFNNFWSVHTDVYYNPEGLSNTALRGGPRVKFPSAINFYRWGFHTDSRKKLVLGPHISYKFIDNGGYDRALDLESTAKIRERLSISFTPNYQERLIPDQFVRAVVDENNLTMYGKRYVVGELKQTTFSAEIRINYTFTPKLTLQTYIQPFISAGSYSRFKEYKQPESYQFLEYGKENSSISSGENNVYTIDPTGGNASDAFGIYNPNFNFKALVGTLVLRWEFSPGSSLYFVWTHNGTNFDNPGNFDLGRDLGDLLKAKADDIFALKFSYWIGK